MQMLFGLICFLLSFITGNLCYLILSPTGPVSVEALVGSSVTLEVSHIGASQPVVTWFMGSLPVASWTVGISSTPDFASNYTNVLTAEQNGSLTFRNVSLGFNGTYTVEMTKIGEGRVSAKFYLFVYDIIKNVSVHTDPGEAIEGESVFTLYSCTITGEAKEVQWFFNGIQLENGSHYFINGKNLTINKPSRNDTGCYTAVLTNPFSTETRHRNITVLYGPDRPVLIVSPTKAVFVSGESVFLSCEGDGIPPPSATWLFNGLSIPTSSAGTVNLTNVKTSQSGIYTCTLKNTRTGAELERNITINIYESPSGEPLCSVQAVSGNTELQFLCVWPGGAPKAQVSFPSLSTNGTGEGNFTVTIRDIQSLNGQEIICNAEHPLIHTQCSVIPCAPLDFRPVIFTNMSQDEHTTVVIHCYSEATPEAVTYWFKDGYRLENGPKYQISTNTAELFINDFNASSTDLNTYTCTAINPLGNRNMDAKLLGPQISASDAFLSNYHTEVTLKWEVPPTSVITGFDIQLKGPALFSPQPLNVASEFRTIQIMPATSRTTNISGLDPKSTYYFRIIPKAGRTVGQQSEQHRIGPGTGLSGAAIAGIAAGIPCCIFVLLFVLGVIYCSKRDGNPKYPVSKPVKVVVSPTSLANPHKILTGRLKPPPEYRLQQFERSGPLPSVNTRMRMATTV
ncbi:LOW QUALITY PROTEIN: V-set and immunoglobulin domain-containing protein 10-like [Myxocyprinus asiaticus]|uniref:LOW QUALITY PROTEIN: V-set and immunoglobulin domain-containing protein 10-like n=1 Tax=Myxocyprinus asiaticus TaxID=70543 RepID=UPI002221C4F0|nr:LOW QUALITY PROTEIN: V-set and immunoglobulin domain-containing protein 10-like [Myxocyprinus asiaticus]